MQPRAFIVMPFGKRRPNEIGPDGTVSSSARQIDFDSVYACLLKPALEKSGFEVARADTAASAGDIRTDMFFELVTADLVVADISIINANVYYELGVRHGVCPRGVFIVHGGSLSSRPFDIAPDRSFTYPGNLFVEPATGENPRPDPSLLAKEVENLARRFIDANSVDRESVGSPVYAHLPGLRPVNWDNIETSKAKYFNALQSDLLECVRNAQRNGRPGDILTLAMNAPTRLHESRILYEAAIALTDLCRYEAAERVLRDVIRLHPEHDEAQLQLAVVLSHLDRTIPAEQQLRKIQRDQRDVPEAANLLGEVYRQLWHVTWKKEEPCDRLAKACEAAQLATTAIHNFLRAYCVDPGAYFAGFNAIMLTHVLERIGVRLDPEIVSAPDLTDVRTMVRFVAANKRIRAITDGDYVTQFWCTTTLAGVHLIEGDKSKALAAIRQACAIPGFTAFQLQTFRDRLDLLASLSVDSDFVEPALTIVDGAIKKVGIRCDCERVVLWAGDTIDRPTQKPRALAVSEVEYLAKKIDSALCEWAINQNDLSICGGITETDVIFAERCLKLGARVRIMLRDPIADETSEPLWPFAEPEWQERFRQLVEPAERKEIWIDTKHLGRPLGAYTQQQPLEFVRRRHQQWILNTACMEAERRTIIQRQQIPKTDVAPAVEKTGIETSHRISSSARLYGLFLWDDSGKRDDLLDITFLIRGVANYANHQGTVKVIGLPQLTGSV
jgi:tetratricopeptide (TPR) repeat protein